MSRLLYDERPLVVNPEIASVLGLNGAIILQQIHYWITINEKAKHNLRDEHYWTYNTYKEWHKQFPFWSTRTIRRLIKDLENKGFIICGNYNKLALDKTRWYRLDYDAVNLAASSGQIGHSSRTDRTEQVASLSTAIPETTTETSIKSIYGEFSNVFLTQNEALKLGSKFGDKLPDMIEQMSAGIESKGYKYKSHYAAILNWERRDLKGEKVGAHKGNSRQLVERGSYTDPEDL